MRKVSLLIFTDGRFDYLQKTLASFHEMNEYPLIEKLLINDCLDADFRRNVDVLAERYELSVIHNESKLGFSGVYNLGFLKTTSQADFTFLLEDDFTFNEPIDMHAMINILELNRNLVQISLKRQAWSDEEKAAGGIIEKCPENYQDFQLDHFKWCQHRMYYTTNPNLTPKFVIDCGWPNVMNSEGMFTFNLFKNPYFQSAIIGHKFDSPKITHIGYKRAGVNY